MSTVYAVTRDGRELFRGSHNECFAWLLRHQPHSTAHASRYEGYAIIPVKGPAP